MDQLNQNWTQVLEIIKTKISSVGFTTWFANLKPIELKANELIILTDMVMAKNTIEGNYMGDLEDALFKVYGFPVHPVIFTENELGTYEQNKDSWNPE